MALPSPTLSEQHKIYPHTHTHTYTNAAAVVAEESANIPCNSTRVIISKNGLCVVWREGVRK